MALEMVLLPVSDVDRAKAYYTQLGFNCDVDHGAEGFRVVQFTPPGSDCSVAFGRGLGAVSQSPIVGLHLVVADLAVAIEELQERGIRVGEPFHYGAAGKQPGIDPGRADYGSYAELIDPDHNVWLLQEVPSRAA
jgi:catechol 2,3-dioxygenase-like lactoylglutathione lyase family enzyme